MTRPFYGVALILTITIEIRAANICTVCQCSSIDQVNVVNCSRLNLSRVPGEEWPDSARTNNTLIRLDISDNKISTLEGLQSTTNRLELIASNCGIKSIASGVFVNTPYIDLVDLSYNLITSEELSADKFRGPYNETTGEPLTHLKHLDLSYNLLHTLIPNLFEHIPQLTSLNLQGNHMHVLDMPTQHALATLKSLNTLNMADNQLTELVQAALEHHAIVTLDLSQNRLDFVPQSLRHIGLSLETLILDSNPIIEFQADSFEGLVVLRQLSLNNLTLLTKITKGTFVPMEKLHSIQMRDNPLLESIEEGAFDAQQQPIDAWYLGNNPKLRQLSVDLLHWSKLTVFKVENTPLECNCELYNISQQLKTILNGANATCEHYATGNTYAIVNMTEIWCKRLTYHHMSIPLAGLIVVASMSAMLAIFLLKHRLKQRQLKAEGTSYSYNLLKTS